MGVLGDNQPGAIRALLEIIAGVVHIATEGCAIALSIFVIGLIFLAAHLYWIGGPIIVVAVAIGAFFRDPERIAPQAEGVVISAADGKVCDIGEGPLPDGSSLDPYRRISVFMSPLNVHVNRAPVGGEVLSVEHTPGAFRAAFSDTASLHNERNLITIAGQDGKVHAMGQVAGYLARRIVCKLRPHDKIQRGERVGLIMFGSRVDHYLPASYRVTVEVGQRVSAGRSVIGELIE